MKNLKSFRIGEAFYFLENKNGSKVRIEVNYALNTCKIIDLINKGDMELLRRQGEIAASHMLGKKAKKNLVEKLLELTI